MADNTVVILWFSIVFQLMAAAYALFLIRVTGLRYSWICISLALILMSVRRIVSLSSGLLGAATMGEPLYEAIGLLLSMLVFVGIVGIRSILVEWRKNQTKVEALLQEKEMILREVHHRIKNNMSTILSFLSLQAETLGSSPARTSIEEAENRVRSMMILYDKLYRGENVDACPIDQYLPLLIDQILATFPNSDSVEVEKSIGNFELDAKRLSLVGIIVNELLTNSMKYAFSDATRGHIRVHAELESGQVLIRFEDNGTGIPAHVDFEGTSDLGLRMIKALTTQLDGTVQLEREEGTCISISFPFQ
ncbi:sensor histidine kinase [Sediminispirochaeta smaragdinae]|jgi:two-component sensor histidine kinase|uniref:histidine kinase n=1 Tax=Sediminispirochaeta smaragdinae (strain DSM 11293 / JCM 15392 / SEBR 4228) TaxID=573413 RepID=E1R6T5_SEDSS|nr:histidine kinase dimerization/phosphoacceptor domain -containing protein [Sediminispirochaeta smaragdinae]ADK79217.1 signal transduction histidine kinase [Sediminispirochaeta smaragdinae DSM 11293]